MTELCETTVHYAILDALQKGERVSDSVFDRIYPDAIRNHSELHWTPVSIAKRAAELLAVDAHTRVLDVGSGCGKFCLVGALTTAGRFYGIEQREYLVGFAQSLVDRYAVDRVLFLQGDIRQVDWSLFHSFYIYNPFIENIYPDEISIDKGVELSEQRFKETVRWVQMRLHLMPIGTRVVTYHGFGGEMPPGYDLQLEEPGDGDMIRLWVKVRE